MGTFMGTFFKPVAQNIRLTRLTVKRSEPAQKAARGIGFSGLGLSDFPTRHGLSEPVNSSTDWPFVAIESEGSQ